MSRRYAVDAITQILIENNYIRLRIKPQNNFDNLNFGGSEDVILPN